jgi:hypothetical protein
MTAHAHDLTVAFADVIVDGSQIDLTGWTCWTHHDASVIRHYARGPCPGCGARAQGHIDETPQPIEPLGPDETEAPPPLPAEPVEIPVRCTCGATHGADGARSCGRRWSIRCPRDQT